MKLTIKGLQESIVALKATAQKYRVALIQRPVKPAFTVIPYETQGNNKIPKTVNVAELMAIMLTAKQLGYTIELRPGQNVKGEFERVDFVFVGAMPDFPTELWY